MKIKIINPVPVLAPDFINGMRNYLKKYIDKDTELVITQLERGFCSIETETQGIINGAEILRLIMDDEDDCDGYFINCFDDPALTGAKEISKKPVLGPYGATVHFASLLSEKIGIITTDDYGFICEERKASAYRVSELIGGVKKADMTVLSLREGNLKENLLKCCREFEQEGIFTAVLGCTGMNFVAEELRDELKKTGCRVQIAEPMLLGVKALELMIKMGYTNSIKSTEIKREDYIK